MSSRPLPGGRRGTCTALCLHSPRDLDTRSSSLSVHVVLSELERASPVLFYRSPRTRGLNSRYRSRRSCLLRPPARVLHGGPPQFAIWQRMQGSKRCLMIFWRCCIVRDPLGYNHLSRV